jgi:hypothetical protein
MLHAIRVDDQQHRPIGGSNGVPPLFAIHNAILAEDNVGIVKDQCRALERDATVSLLVDAVFSAVPLESHRYTIRITFRPWEINCPGWPGRRRIPPSASTVSSLPAYGSRTARDFRAAPQPSHIRPESQFLKLKDGSILACHRPVHSSWTFEEPG